MNSELSPVMQPLLIMLQLLPATAIGRATAKNILKKKPRGLWRDYDLLVIDLPDILRLLFTDVGFKNK